MSKNKNLHEIAYEDDGTMSIGNYINVIWTGRRNNSGHKIFSAECKDCGTIIENNMSDLKRMSLKCNHNNKLHSCHRSLVYGVGINDMPVGWIGASSYNTRLYNTWKAMLYRTTQQCWEELPCYYGTTVCNEWVYLSNFEKDIQELDGYSLWKNNPNTGVMLDKDTKVLGNKHYSKDTCCFLSHADSNRDVYNRHPESQLKAAMAFGDKYGKPIRAININDGSIIEFKSKKEAGRELGILPANIWMILSDDPKYSSNTKAKDKNGNIWTFELM